MYRPNKQKAGLANSMQPQEQNARELSEQEYNLNLSRQLLSKCLKYSLSRLPIKPPLRFALQLFSNLSLKYYTPLPQKALSQSSPKPPRQLSAPMPAIALLMTTESPILAFKSDTDCSHSGKINKFSEETMKQIMKICVEQQKEKLPAGSNEQKIKPLDFMEYEDQAYRTRPGPYNLAETEWNTNDFQYGGREAEEYEAMLSEECDVDKIDQSIAEIKRALAELQTSPPPSTRLTETQTQAAFPSAQTDAFASRWRQAGL